MKKQITPAFLELLFVFFEVSFKKPEDKKRSHLFSTDSFQRARIY
jgi:hypothetical protein